MKVTSKSRTCPACDAPVGFKRLWLGAWVGARWHCARCGVELGFSFRRRTWVAILSSIPLAVGFSPLLDGKVWPLLICGPIWLWIWTYDAVEMKRTLETGGGGARS